MFCPSQTPRGPSCTGLERSGVLFEKREYGTIWVYLDKYKLSDKL